MVEVAARIRGETEKTSTEEAPICFRNATPTKASGKSYFLSRLLFQW
jgi:hypothetical protein